MLAEFDAWARQLLLACWPLAVFWLAGCSSGSAPVQTPGAAGDVSGSSREALPQAPVTKPVRKTLVRRTEQPGQIEPYQQTPLYAKVSGFVTTLEVDIGDRVRGPRYDDQGVLVEPGQLLAELSVPELEDELRQKQAAEAQALADIKQAGAAVEVAQAARASAAALVTEAKAAADHARAEYERSQLDFQRVSELFADQAITRKALDEAQQNLQGAAAGQREAVAKIASAEAALEEKTALIRKSQADLAAAEARSGVTQADRRRIGTLLNYTAIRAPFDGVVAQRGVDAGHLVPVGHAADKPLFVIVRGDLLRIVVEVPEGDASTVEAGSEALLRVPALGGTLFPAKVARTAWVLNTGTRTLRTEIDLPNADGRLRPGMYAYAELKVAERRDALALPKSAILTQDGPPGCLQVDETGQIVRTPLVLGLQAGSDVEVVEGLSGTERVIAVNVGAYRPGQQVLPVPFKTPSK